MNDGNAISKLCQAAFAARENAYAPYSQFPVGAAVLCSEGKIFSGCNVENASFGLTICAERVALCKAVSEGESSPIAIALATSGGHNPCGACRQVMAEFAADLRVFVGDAERPDEPFVETSLRELLPGTFRFTR